MCKFKPFRDVWTYVLITDWTMATVHSQRIALNSEKPEEILLNRYFLGVSRKGYARYGPNRVCMPIYFDRFVDRIANLQVNDSDIFTISFPKTGTTWTQEMVWCIANDMDFKGAEQELAVRFPFLDHSPLFDYSTLMSENPSCTFPEFVLDSVSYIEKMKSPRFIKTHLPWELLPHQVQTGATKAKIIYVTRNPKDTCVSYFHHCQLLECFTGNFDDFVTLFTENLVCFAPYWRHIQTYWSHRNDPNVLFIRYEDMKKDLRQIIRQVAAFLNKTLSEEQIAALEQHLSFDSMKNNRAVNYEAAVEINKKYNLTDRDGQFMRAGQVGNYKTLMTPEIVKKINRWSEKHVDEKYRNDFKDYLL